jgi:hypothetical protein
MKTLLTSLPDMVTIVRILGALLCLGGIAICLRLMFLRETDMAEGRSVRLWHVNLPTVEYYKLMALAGLLVLPVAAAFVANYHVFEGVHDPHSQTLAARHFQKKWIAEQQCYNCHADYGLSGSLEAKMDGYRHLARYVTGTHTEPIRFRGIFDNHNCLHCHQGTAKFVKVASHHTVAVRLETSEMSCLNCHGRAHPSREQRTPGSPDYERLMAKESK